MEEKENNNKKKKKVIDIILDFVLVILIIVCALSIYFKLSFVKVVVNGESMTPNIQDGSKGYMQKVRANTKIERFDVVTGTYDSKADYYIIKRVLGLPGENVTLKSNKLYINDEEVEQTFNFNKRIFDFQTTSWTLGDDEYLLVGDNRAGTIEPVVEKKENITAKNGFSYAIYDVNASSCKASSDYSSCPIKSRGWYWFKEGINN